MENKEQQDKKVIVKFKLNINLYETFLSKDESIKIFNMIKEKVPLVKNKRSNLTFGDDGLVYEIKFGGYYNKPITIIKRQCIPWKELPILIELRDKVSKLTKEKYNFCVIQRYSKGVGISPHRDKEMKKETTICGLSLGNTRILIMSPPKFVKEPPIKIELNPGSLYILKSPTNDYWTHCIEKKGEERISLTFRNVSNIE